MNKEEKPGLVRSTAEILGKREPSSVLLAKQGTGKSLLSTILLFSTAWIFVPSFVILADLLFFAPKSSKEMAATLFFDKCPLIFSELIFLGLPSLAFGWCIEIILVMLFKQKISANNFIQITLAQICSVWISIAALLHNPQEEFCSRSEIGLRVTRIYVEDVCSPSMSFLMLQLCWALAFFAFIVVVSKFIFAVIASKGEKNG